ncbi:MAG: hypothetical protein WC378_15800 [Opitutaceae bacterium]|jgi:hypothetical protein
MTYLEECARAIRELHGCKCAHVRTVPVSEVFRGREIWRGDVEVFDLTGHAKARRAYAWGYPSDKPGDGWEITTVLEIPPVDSPQTAVKIAIAAHARRRGSS